MTTAQERSDLLDELGLGGQNKAALGKVLNTGNIGKATERPDGVMEATVRIRPDEICWDPSILVLPHGGDLELTLINDDPPDLSAQELQVLYLYGTGSTLAASHTISPTRTPCSAMATAFLASPCPTM